LFGWVFNITLFCKTSAKRFVRLKARTEGRNWTELNLVYM